MQMRVWPADVRIWRTAEPMSPSGPGRVILIGAGPGDPGLITVKGMQYLRDAQVVVYDRLVAHELLSEARPTAEFFNVGKASGHHLIPQEEINDLLIAKAREGKLVARLKGGDPFVFGRGGEEAEALADAGIPFEIVPGVSSAVAVPAYAGIPLTERGVASSFTVRTGHRAASRSRDELDGRLRREGAETGSGTLIVLMCAENLPSIISDLLDEGWASETPAALISEGTTSRQRTIVGTLADIASKGEGATPPTLLIVGQVVRKREQLDWFERKEVVAWPQRM